MNYEQQFLDALKSIFIGAKVEGESGYINLMKIKSSYFEKGVFPQLMKDIDAACKPFEKGFREELFDKLYDFFQHYFSESGSIYFRNTAQHHNIYEKVYTDDRDVMLFWKTHMLYYVKTDRLFNSMDVEVDGEKFHFDVSGMELKRSNEKRELTYSFKSFREGKTTLTVGYSEKGRKTKIDEIVKAVKTKGMILSEEILEKSFRVFEKQSEVDYFINKNARAFLCEQFDLWMYQYLFKGESIFNETRLQQLQAIKEIAYKIIDFIAQFEDELVRVWNKPKFVLNSNYIITLDHVIASRSLAKQSPVKRGKAEDKGIASGKNTPCNDILDRIFKHKGVKEQIAEWIELGMVDKKFKPEMVLEKDLVGDPLYPQYQYLPLDTKYFKDLELDILALFDDLDASLDGWLIHSENYQALKTISPKFQKQVQVIYIDPPYNTAASEIIYSNNYKHSSWITFMENRITLSRSLMKNDGVKIVAIDDTEMVGLSQLLEVMFPNHDRSVVVVNHHPAGAGLEGTNISTTHEYAIFMTPHGKKVLYGEKKGEEIGKIGFIRTGTAKSNLRIGRPNSFYAILVDPKDSKVVGAEEPPRGNNYPRDKTKEGLIRIYPMSADGTERVWRRSYESCLKEIENENVECQNNRTLYLLSDDSDKHKPIFSNWTDTKYNAGAYGTNVLTDLLGTPIFSYPKSVFNVMECISSATIRANASIVLDYFGGSGTTAHAVMNLNRDGGKHKYILAEIGEHFNTVILPRVKKLAFSDKWKNGKAQEGKGISHFAKYFELEQYEDSLSKARYEDAPLFASTQDAYTSYVFLRDLKMLEAVKVDKKKNKVEVNLEKLYTGIDLAETLSCLTGKWIKRITEDTVEFQDGTTASLSEPKWDDIKPLIWW
jgi:adenine-specific DNA-methyltransferase